MRLELHNIHKSFGDNEVLKGVDLVVEPGRITALVGENGAGKSTLTRVISGAYQPQDGELLIDGEPVRFAGPQAAMVAGIQVIYQEFRQNLFAHLDVAQNLFVLDRGARFGRLSVRRKAMQAAARELLLTVGLSIDPRREVASLTVAEQQQIEIAKAISEDVKVLILDEPTAALDETESQFLFDQVRRLRDEGVAIVYISHRLKEVFDLADQIVVLRDGKVALSDTPAKLTETAVVTAMAGRTVEDLYPRHSAPSDRVRLELRALSVAGSFEDVDLSVHAGEVVGVAGVAGSGKGAVARAVFGLAPVTSGTVLLDGEPVALGSAQRAMDAGIAYISPDRQAEGLALAQSVGDNITLASTGRFSRGGWMDRRRERDAATGLVDRLGIRTPSVTTEVGQLSGGNQQKTLFARWVLREPKVLLMEEPTRGVDVAAKADIYQIIDEQTRAGAAVVLVSSDLPELVAMCDRVVVIRHGHVVAQLSGAELSEQTVLEHALESAS